jgi:predicted nucleic acid-binding protein
MPLRNPVVLDTDVASFLWRGKLEPEHHRKLVGCTAMLTFVTIAEFWQGAYKANWDQQQITRMTDFYGKFDLVRCDFDVVKTWASSQDSPCRRALPYRPMTAGSRLAVSATTIPC